MSLFLSQTIAPFAYRTRAHTCCAPLPLSKAVWKQRPPPPHQAIASANASNSNAVAQSLAQAAAQGGTASNTVASAIAQVSSAVLLASACTVP